MHEMGITQGILAASFDAARDAGADSISEIRISIGELTEIQEFALQFAFEALTPGTMAEGATLIVTHIPARSKCNECGIEYTHDRFEMLCPECGSFNVTPLTGREMQIDSIETPDDEDTPSTDSEE
jgi:hydrogenase nickel incorporation protein HypA/HybF